MCKKFEISIILSTTHICCSRGRQNHMFTLEIFTRLRYKIFVVCLMVLSLSLSYYFTHSLRNYDFLMQGIEILKKIKVCHEHLFKKKTSSQYTACFLKLFRLSTICMLSLTNSLSLSLFSSRGGKELCKKRLK